MKYTILYFSGTGGTQLIAEEFHNTLNTSELFKVDQFEDYKAIYESIQTTSQLILLFPVYACDAPSLIYEWIKDYHLRKHNDENQNHKDVHSEQSTAHNEQRTAQSEPHKIKKAFVISVSGGGDVWPNTGCRNEVIKRLEFSGFRIFHEDMMVMPSNWTIKTQPDASAWLIKSIPVKVKQLANLYEKGIPVIRKQKNKDAIQNLLSVLEQKMAHKFAKGFRINSHCNQCGWCVRSCPTSNIVLNIESGAIEFDLKCIMCFRCVYGCPQNAIDTKSKQVLKNGFSIKQYQELASNSKLKSIKACTKGLLWIGVRNYLIEIFGDEE